MRATQQFSIDQFSIDQLSNIDSIKREFFSYFKSAGTLTFPFLDGDMVKKVRFCAKQIDKKSEQKNKENWNCNKGESKENPTKNIF